MPEVFLHSDQKLYAYQSHVKICDQICNVIVSVYQKWLYSRNAPTVDANGSEYACGGRKNRAGMEALLRG